MEKLQMCRVCLVKDTRMYVVVNKSLHELFMKLTAKPFVTEDRRPRLVCYFCCTKLKQCCRFQRKCLEAEELFAQILDEDNKPNPLINPDLIDFNNGFIKSTIEHISIVAECQTESHATSIKEEPADIIEPKEELQIDGAPVAKKPKLLTRRTELEDVITEELNKNEQPYSQIIRTTHNRSSKQFPKFEEPSIYIKSRVNSNSQNNTNLDASFCNNSGKDIIKCKISNKGNDSDDVNRHRRLYVKEKPYKCEVCQYSCGQKSHLISHVRIHTNEKPYKCDICEYSCRQKGDLTNHVRIHTNERPYKCDVCLRSFALRNNLIRHIRKHNDEKPYKCDVCQSRFSAKNSLIRHSRIHTGEKPYKCDICQSRFSAKNSLMRHSRIHSGEKLYKCDVCEYSCIKKGDLSKHVRIHTNGKPYKCDVCEYSCSRKGHLMRHSRIHTGEKPYKCDVCQSRFSAKNSLMRHSRIHSGEKLYKCDVCEYSCIKKGDLSKHVRIHTNGNP